MKKVLIAVLFLSACTNPPYDIILNKSVMEDNPYLSYYAFSTNSSLEYVKFIDSTNRYNIGDSVKKYSKN